MKNLTATIIAIGLCLAATSASGAPGKDFDCPAIKERAAALMRMNEALENLGAQMAAELFGSEYQDKSLAEVIFSTLQESDRDGRKAAEIYAPILDNMVPLDDSGAVSVAADYALIYAAFCKD